MCPVRESFDINRANWDERAPVHAASPGYAVERFLADPAYVSDVVAFDRPLLGSVEGSAGSTCSATSAPTPSRWPGSGRG